MKVSLRTVVMNIPPQDVITQDNVSIKVNAVIYFRVLQPIKRLLKWKLPDGDLQFSQTTLRSVLSDSLNWTTCSPKGKKSTCDYVANYRFSYGALGIKVSNVEVKQIDLPQEMQRAMAKQAEAERERRSKVIAAEGEFVFHNAWPMQQKFWPNSPVRLRYAIFKPSERSPRRTTRQPFSRSPSIY